MFASNTIRDRRPNAAVDCWLLFGVGGIHAKSDRTVGGQRGHGFQRGFLRAEFKQVDAVPLLDGRLRSTASSWEPGDVPSVNLNGTFAALDCYSTPGDCVALYYNTSLRPGFLNLDGYTVVDDSLNTQFDLDRLDSAGLPWYSSPAGGQRQDLYLFHYGLDFSAGMQMFVNFTGRPPMMPRPFYNVWWSRYYTYSWDSYVQEVLQQYAAHDLPLTVAVMDME